MRPWLKHHPTIEIVARDRSKEFAAAITAALPQATHVAGRWHVAKNLTEYLDRVVSARWKHLSKRFGPAEASLEPVQDSPRHRNRQSAGEERYQQALVLVQAGLSTSAIAQRLGVGERTIQRWLTQQHGPYAGPRKPSIWNPACSPMSQRNSAPGISAWSARSNLPIIGNSCSPGRSVPRKWPSIVSG